MDKDSTLVSDHGSYFFLKHFYSEKHFLKFVESLHPSSNEILHFSLYYISSENTYYYQEIDPNTGYFPSVYRDIRKALRERLNQELTNLITEFWTNIMDRSEGNIRIQSSTIIRLLLDLYNRTRNWKAFKDYNLNHTVFYNLITEKLIKLIDKKHLDIDLITKLEQISFEFIPKYHLSRFMDEQRWRKLSNWLEKNKDKLIKRNEMVRFVKNDLPAKGYLASVPSEKEIIAIIMDTWSIRVSLSSVKSVKRGECSIFQFEKYSE